MDVYQLLRRYQVIGSILLIIFLFGLLMVLPYLKAASVVNMTEVRKQASESIFLLENITTGLKDMDAGLRDYIATGQEDHVNAHQDAEKRTNSATADLERLMAGDPASRRIIGTLSALIDQQRKSDRQIIDAYENLGVVPARELMRNVRSEQLTLELRNTLAEMRDAQKERFRALDAAFRADRKQALIILILGNLFGMIVVIWSLILARREFALRKRSEESGRAFLATASQTSDLVVVTDMNRTIEYVNKAVEDATGYTASRLVGKSTDLLRSGDEHETLTREQQEELLAGRSVRIEAMKRRKDGGLFAVEETMTPIKDGEGAVAHFVSTARDVSRQKTMEASIQQLMYYDSLTRLPRRALFTDRLSKEIERAKPESRAVVVLLAEIDRFKLMNNLLGADAGDETVKLVAARIVSALGAAENAYVARLGSDEFGIILWGVPSPEDVMHAAKQVLGSVAQPAVIRGEKALLTVGVGVALYPENGTDAQTLIKNADAALSDARLNGRSNIQFYASDMNQRAADQLDLERSLFSALVNKEYLLNYQPYHDLITQDIRGAEALIKWNHPTLGLVPPVQFIPALENTGMIIDVGEWVLRTACSQLKKWNARRALFPVSVNLSGVQFRHKYLVDTVRSAIEEFEVDPAHLTIELTESIFMQDMGFAQGVLKKLKNIGVAISVDDFGTGYSSLSYLKKLPVDTVKIDKSFVDDITTDPDAAAIVTAITTMARSLNLKTIAEGVETEEQVKILRLLRCDIGQGYYFNPALPPAQFEKYLY